MHTILIMIVELWAACKITLRQTPPQTHSPRHIPPKPQPFGQQLVCVSQ